MCVRANAKNGADSKPSSGKYDYDLAIIGAGVGGHGAALHAVEQGLKVAIIEGHDIGGTCVNRGCVPSKALLAAAGQLRHLKDEHHMKQLGIQLPGAVGFDRQQIADHANGLAGTIQGNLKRSLEAMGVVRCNPGTAAAALVCWGGAVRGMQAPMLLLPLPALRLMPARAPG